MKLRFEFINGGHIIAPIDTELTAREVVAKIFEYDLVIGDNFAFEVDKLAYVEAI